jgi:hypothetical protein
VSGLPFDRACELELFVLTYLLDLLWSGTLHAALVQGVGDRPFQDESTNLAKRSAQLLRRGKGCRALFIGGSSLKTRKACERQTLSSYDRLAAQGQARPFALVEPHAGFTLTPRHSPRQSSLRSRANAVDVRLLYLLEKCVWAGRDRAPRTQRRCGMVSGWSELRSRVDRRRPMPANAGDSVLTFLASAQMDRDRARPSDGSRRDDGTGDRRRVDGPMARRGPWLGLRWLRPHFVAEIGPAMGLSERRAVSGASNGGWVCKTAAGFARGLCHSRWGVCLWVEIKKLRKLV